MIDTNLISDRIEALQYVRALAILLTLVAHLTYFTDTPDPLYIDVIRGVAQFWGGVEMFFVLSGFVITASLMRSLETGRQKRKILKRFYFKRVTRLMPAALFWGGMVLLGSFIFNQSGIFGEPEQNIRHYLAATFFVQNIHLTFDHAPTYSIYWSLSIEEQFYLFYPILLFVARKHLGLVSILLILPQIVLKRPVSQNELVFMVRYDALLWGVWLYAVYRNPRFHRFMDAVRPIRGLLLGILLIAIVAAPVWFGKIDYAASATDTLCMMFVAVVIHFRNDFILKEGALRRALNWLGDRSYAIYLCHIPVIYFVREVGFRGAPDISPASLTDPRIIIPFALIFLCADLTYRGIEMPVRNWGRSRIKETGPAKGNVV